MVSIRIHGRGGQGAVTAAELIAVSAFYDGKFSQAFPSFGVERRGAPVEAYARIDKKPISLRSHIYHPDYIIIQDPTLLDQAEVSKGFIKKTLFIINTEKEIKQLINFFQGRTIKTVPATSIALKVLGKPIVNTVILGAFAGFTKLISYPSLKKAILERFKGEAGKKNLEAMKIAYCHADADNKYCFQEKESRVGLDDSQRLAIKG